MPDRLARVLPWAVPLGGLLLFAALWLPHRGFWLDDAFITFRYARNLADGVGPVFNPGEHVEGYTNFAWMLLSAAAFATLSEGAALVAIKAAGLALGAFVLWRCFTFPSLSTMTGQATPPRPHVRLAVLLLAAHPVFVANCGDGLETPLFMAWGIENARALVRAPTPRSGALLGVLTAGAVWTRPEALPLLLVWPVLVAACRRPRRLAGWHAGFALASLPPVLGQLAWRWAYYGQPFPNTFVAKATGALGPRLEAGLRDVAAFAGVGVSFPPLATWLAGGLAVFGTLALLRGPARGTADEAAGVRTGLAGLWALVGFRLAFDVWSGSEFMGTYRFLAPALPPALRAGRRGPRARSRSCPPGRGGGGRARHGGGVRGQRAARRGAGTLRARARSGTRRRRALAAGVATARHPGGGRRRGRDSVLQRASGDRPVGSLGRRHRPSARRVRRPSRHGRVRALPPPGRDRSLEPGADPARSRPAAARPRPTLRPRDRRASGLPPRLPLRARVHVPRAHRTPPPRRASRRTAPLDPTATTWTSSRTVPTGRCAGTSEPRAARPDTPRPAP